MVDMCRKNSGNCFVSSSLVLFSSRSSSVSSSSQLTVLSLFNRCLKSHFCHILVAVCLDLSVNLVDFSTARPAGLDACLAITSFNLID